MSQAERELMQLVRSCLEGDLHARGDFQSLLGEFIYNYPMKTFHLSKDRAADFYIYIFESDRIFRRLRGFQGRNDAQFRTYLGFYVLRDLFYEWQRTQKEVETVSLETDLTGSDPGVDSGTLKDIIGNPSDGPETLMESQAKAGWIKGVLESMDLEKRVLLKILHIMEFDLTPQEIRFLCKKSGCSYKEVITRIEEIRTGLSRKDEQFASLQDHLDSIFGWILLYQRELAKISEALSSVREASSRHTELCREKEELGRKLEWRYRQRGQALNKVGKFRVNTQYKDIARLMNVPIGTVCSLVSRIRAEILRAFGAPEVSTQTSVS